MKIKFMIITLFAVCVLAAVFTAYATAGTNPLLGTWRMVFAKFDGETTTLADGQIKFKHVTPTHFFWFTHDGNGQVLRGAGGIYSLQGNVYVETVEYGVGSVFGSIVGRTHTFTYRIEGDQWFHTGNRADGKAIEEVWVRVRNTP